MSEWLWRRMLRQSRPRHRRIGASKSAGVIQYCALDTLAMVKVREFFSGRTLALDWVQWRSDATEDIGVTETASRCSGRQGVNYFFRPANSNRRRSCGR